MKDHHGEHEWLPWREAELAFKIRKTKDRAGATSLGKHVSQCNNGARINQCVMESMYRNVKMRQS